MFERYTPPCALKCGSLLIISPIWHRYNANKVSSFSILSMQISSSNDLEFPTKYCISCAIDKAAQYIMLNLSSTVFCIYKNTLQAKKKSSLSLPNHIGFDPSVIRSLLSNVLMSCADSSIKLALSSIISSPLCFHVPANYLHSYLLSAKHLTSD